MTEEVWSWCRIDDGALPGFESPSVHLSTWPDGNRLRDLAGDADATTLTVASEVLGRIRKAKSDAKVSMRADVESVVVADTPVRLAALDAASTDVRDAGKVAELVTAAVSDGQEPSVTVRLAEVPADPTPQG